MATNLLIGYPDIPWSASTPTLTVGTADASYPAKNVITGSRREYFRVTAAVGLMTIKFDLGASVTKALSYAFIARANILKSQGAVSALIESSPDDAVWTSRIGTSANLQTKTYSGPRSEDLMIASGFNDDIAGSLPTSAFRYWRMTYGAASPTGKWAFSKLYMGSFFDWGRDPSFTLTTTPRMSIRNRAPALNFSLTWEGVTETKVNSFISTIYRYRDINPVVLYDIADKVFFGYRTLHCKIVNAEIEVTSPAYRNIRVTFEELI